MTLADWLEQTAVPWFTSLGLTKRTVTLEVVGRTSGKPRKVTVASVRKGSFRYLVSVHGESNWVRNVRAANGWATIISAGRTSIRLIEIPVEERAPILHQYVGQGAFGRSAAEIASQFGVEPDAAIAEIESLASRHPVFRVEESS